MKKNTKKTTFVLVKFERVCDGNLIFESNWIKVGVDGYDGDSSPTQSNTMFYMLISSPASSLFLFFSKWNPIEFSQRRLSLVSALMLMNHLSSARSLISSPYLPHHFIWPKGNNKSLIHYPLTEAAMRKYLITGNKLNFNHSIFQWCAAHYGSRPGEYARRRSSELCVSVRSNEGSPLVLYFISASMRNEDFLD